MSLAFVFPGQGSQSLGMMSTLAPLSPTIRATFAEASEVLGYDLWQLCQEGPAERLNATLCTQPAMLTAGIATYRLWLERGGAVPACVAGHSLGEFTALVAAGCLDFKTAVALVEYRAAAMQAAVPEGEGAMAAIIGLTDPEVEAACLAASGSGVVEAVNFNAPGQVVIAGEVAAVEHAARAATAAGARLAKRLPVSVPAHSSLMLPAAERLRERLLDTPVAAASSVLYGVDAKPHSQPEQIRADLVKQLHTPVYWSATIRALIAGGATSIVECGPGKVLTALNRRVDRNRALKMFALEDPESFDEGLASLESVTRG